MLNDHIILNILLLSENNTGNNIFYISIEPYEEDHPAFPSFILDHGCKDYII